MLDPKLIAYLREHPDIFSDVVVYFLRGSDGRDNTSFSMRRVGGQVREKEKKKRRVEPPIGPNLWDDVLNDDVRKNEILARLVREVERDERVLIDLLLLALVSKNLRRDVTTLLETLETRIEVMPLYCRALFEYTREVDTFNFFLERIEDYAPATHAAWLVMARDDATRRELGTVMDYLRRHRPRHFEVALTNNGLDPIATALCMHHMARPDMGFSSSIVEKLQPLVLDKVWASFAMTWEDLAFIPMPSHVTAEDVIRACTARCALDGGVDFFMPLFQKLIENVKLKFSHLLRVSKRDWKNLARFDAGLPLQVIRFYAQSGGFRAFDDEALYQWLKASVVRNEEVGIDVDQAIFLNMNEGIITLDAVVADNSHVQEILDIAARLLARRSISPTVFGDMFKHLGVYSPDQREYFMARGLVWAIRKGNRPFIDTWIKKVWPTYEQLGRPTGFKSLSHILHAFTDLDNVAKHDPDATLQTFLVKFFSDKIPSLLERFQVHTSVYPNTLCLGDNLHSLLIEIPGDPMTDGDWRDYLDKGHLFFQILHQESVDGVKRLFSEDDDEGAGVLHQWLFVADEFREYKPLIARSLFDSIVDHVETILQQGGDAAENIDLWDGLFGNGEVPAEFKWRLIHSDVFTIIFPTFDREQRKEAFHFLLLESSNSLILGTKLLALFTKRTEQVRVIDSLLPYVISERRDMDQFVQWNLAFRIVQMSEFAQGSKVPFKEMARFRRTIERLSFLAPLKQLREAVRSKE